MKLAELIEKLQKLVKEDPHLANFATKFRSGTKQEDFTYFHLEGRTLIFSESWANQVMLKSDKESKAFAEKVKMLASEPG